MMPLPSIEASAPMSIADENGETASRNQKHCRANIVASASGEQGTLHQSALSHISLHCLPILGAWSTFNDMREHIPRRSPLLVAGTAVGNPLDDGELVPFSVPARLFAF